MTDDLEKVQQLLNDEIQSIRDVGLRGRVSSMLTKPSLIRCAWDYGDPGQTYLCWKVVGEPAVEDVGIVYCEYGFGPECPWGLIWLSEEVPRMGQDSGWFRTFREAAADQLHISPASLNVG